MNTKQNPIPKDHIDYYEEPTDGQKRDYIDELCLVSMESEFEDAAKYLQKKKKLKVPQEMQLKFYGYFKQATVGKCNVKKPGLLDWVGRAKWDAWNKLGDMSKDDAMMNYMAELEVIAPTWKDEAIEMELAAEEEEAEDNKDDGTGGAMGPPALSRPVFGDEGYVDFYR